MTDYFDAVLSRVIVYFREKPREREVTVDRKADIELVLSRKMLYDTVNDGSGWCRMINICFNSSKI